MMPSQAETDQTQWIGGVGEYPINRRGGAG